MVVCKFFQQGYCRFGQNCRFDHIYGSKYSYHAPQNPAPQAPVQFKSQVTDEQLVNQVQSNVKDVLNGGQWILSSYAPFKEKPAMPGITELSPEEARLFIYEAKANNNVDQAVSYMNNLLQTNKQKYEQLLNPSPAIIAVLRKLYNSENVSSPFSDTAQISFASSNSAASVFRGANQNTGGNPTSSVFNQSPFSNPTQPSPFNNSSSAASLFRSAAQNNAASPPSVFNTNPFPASDTSAKSIFSSASQQFFDAPNPNTQNNPFQTAPSPFASNQGNPSPFSNTQNVFQNANVAANVADTGVYSNMDDLSEQDLEAFKNDHFKLGFVPELAPPQALC